MKRIRGFLDRHVEHVGDGFLAIFDLQRFAVVALALADIASDVDVWQEVHLDLDDAVALAGFAASALDVEREAAGLIAARFRFGQACEPFADRREGAGIGRRIGARRAADRRLIDIDHLVEMFEPVDALMWRRMFERAIEPSRDVFIKRVDDERRFAAARNAGDAGEKSERDLGRDILQIIAGGIDDLELARPVPACAACAARPLPSRRINIAPVSDFGSP